jgi:hypothetical protein
MKTLSSSVAFQDEAGNPLANGSIVLTLPFGVYEIAAGGGQVAGQSLIVNLDANGKVPGTPQLWASDELNPQTPYTVSICSGAGGLGPIASATWLIAGASPIDLALMINTSASPVGLPAIGPAYIVVPFSATAAFVYAGGFQPVLTFEMTLTGAVTAPTVSGLLPGQLVIFKLIQDAAGGHAFSWPGIVKNPLALDPAPNTRNVQIFVYNGTFLDPLADLRSNT